GDTALHISCQYGQFKVVKFLKEKGADMAWHNYVGHTAWDELIMFCIVNDGNPKTIEIKKFIVEGCQRTTFLPLLNAIVPLDNQLQDAAARAHRQQIELRRKIDELREEDERLTHFYNYLLENDNDLHQRYRICYERYWRVNVAIFLGDAKLF